MFLRKFIILNKQDSTDAKGHVRLEVRGSKAKLSLSLEGVDGETKSLYKLYIVADEENTLKEVELGTVNVDKAGRGKLELSFNPSSVDKNGGDISIYNVFLIREEGRNSSKMILGGYIHKDDDSLAKIKNKKEKKARIIRQEEVKVEEQAKIEEETENEVKHSDMIGVSEEVKDVVEEIQEQELEEAIEEKTYDINYNSEHYSQQIAIYTQDILKFFKKVNPFKIEFEHYAWWQIDYNDMNSHRGFLPYYNYILDSNYQNKLGEKSASCQSQIKKYDHYLFGMIENKGNITHYVYGIPGKYERAEHPYEGTTGFVTWLEGKDQVGYWLSYIDAHTGNVVRPLK